MIRLQVATLSDTANVREGLSNILSAGITLLKRPVFPAPIGATLIIVTEMSDERPGIEHRVRIVVRKRDTEDLLLEAEVRLRSAATAELDENGNAAIATAPIVISLGAVIALSPGGYEAVVFGDEAEIGGARFDMILDPAMATPFTPQPVPSSGI